MRSRAFLITGASKGIGRSLAEILSASGHKVVGIARGADDGFPGRLVQVDLADRGRTAVVLEALTREHSFDGLINNVGLAKPQALGPLILMSSTR